MTSRKEVMDLFNAGAISEQKRDAWLDYLRRESGSSEQLERNSCMRPDTLRRKKRNTQAGLLFDLLSMPEFWPGVVVIAILLDFFI